MGAPGRAGSELEVRVAALERQNKLLAEGLKQAERIRGLWGEAVRQLKAAKKELENRNADLATLFEVSSAAAHSVDLDELCSVILKSMAAAVPLAPDSEYGIFLVEGREMKLAAHVGGGAEFEAAHRGLKVGDCLCGLAADNCKIVTTGSCADDPRHTLRYGASKPHGHIIIPLKAQDRVVAVFYCYVPEHTALDERKYRTLTAIGEQLGMAIDRSRLYEEKKALSMHDALTGLANRRYMDGALARYLASAKRYGTGLSVIMLDIDYFKKYNDTLGHMAGDRLLGKVARTIAAEMREADVAVRYGGEEFLLILPETSADRATALAERIRNKVERKLPVTISLGIASLLSPKCSRDQLVNMADQALYRAKATGRNRVEVWRDQKPSGKD